MILSVFDIDATAELLEDMPRRYGGWIESRNNYQITLRIKADRLFEAMAQLEEIGIVLDKSLYAEDVTAEYVDLESRIRVLEQIVAQLEALLAKAKTVEEALRIRVELDRMRIELEAARVRMRALSGTDRLLHADRPARAARDRGAAVEQRSIPVGQRDGRRGDGVAMKKQRESDGILSRWGTATAETQPRCTRG